MRRFVLFTFAIAATACLNVNSPLQPTVALGTPFELKVGQTAVVPGGLSIRFDEVASDSRCPIDAICVWAGEARVAMTLSEGSGPKVKREWRTNPTNFAVSYDDYSIQLGELRPYPQGMGQTPQGDYVATLTVIKR